MADFSLAELAVIKKMGDEIQQAGAQFEKIKSTQPDDIKDGFFDPLPLFNGDIDKIKAHCSHLKSYAAQFYYIQGCRDSLINRRTEPGFFAAWNALGPLIPYLANMATVEKNTPQKGEADVSTRPIQAGGTPATRQVKKKKVNLSHKEPACDPPAGVDCRWVNSLAELCSHEHLLRSERGCRKILAVGGWFGRAINKKLAKPTLQTWIHPEGMKALKKPKKR